MSTHFELRYDFRMEFARLVATLARAPDVTRDVELDRFCLGMLPGLQNLFEWMLEHRPSRSKDVKRFIKEFFAHWSFHYVLPTGSDEADKIFYIQALSDFVTQMHKLPELSQLARGLSSRTRTAIRRNEFKGLPGKLMPDVGGVLKLFRCNDATFGVLKQAGRPATLFRLSEMAKASNVVRAMMQQVWQEDLPDLPSDTFVEMVEELRKAAHSNLWEPLHENYRKTSQSIVVLREGLLLDLFLYPLQPQLPMVQEKNYLNLCLRQEIQGQTPTKLDVVVGDHDAKRSPSVNREIGIVTQWHKQVFPVGSPVHLMAVAGRAIRRLYAIGHSYAPAEYHVSGERFWPTIQIGNSFIDLTVLNALQIFANGCDLGSAYRGEDDLWTSLPEGFLSRGAHIVIAPVTVTSQFWALGLMVTTLEAEQNGLSFREAFESARAMILSGKWTNSFIEFMDQNIRPFLRNMARQQAKIVSREIDPLEALNKFPPAEIVEWYTGEDVWSFGMKVRDNPGLDPVELAETHFYEAGLRVWEEVRAAQRPKPFADFILQAGYRVWGGL